MVYTRCRFSRQPGNAEPRRQFPNLHPYCSTVRRTSRFLTLELSGPVDKWNATISEATDVRTDNVRSVNNTLYWKGDLKDGGSATFVVRVVSASLIVDFEAANAMTGTSVESVRIGEASGSEMLLLTGQVGPLGEPPVAQDNETVTVQFSGPVDHEQIDFSKLIEYQDGDDLLLRNEAEISSRQQVTVVLSLTNGSDKPVYTLLIDSLAIEDSHGASLDADARTCRLDAKRAWVNKGRGATVPLNALGDEYGKNAISAFMIRTEPGETSEARVRGTVIGSPDCVLAGMAGAYMTATGPGNETAPKLAFIRHLLGQQPKWTQAVKFFILLSDEKSVKTDTAQTYGNGQGPTTGLRWGETEDYLYVPNTAVAAPGGFGPDMSITSESNLQTDLLAATISAAGTNKIAGLNLLKLQILNRGDRISQNATLEIEMDPYGGIPPIISTGWVGCLTCTVASAQVSQIDMAYGSTNNPLPITEVCEGSDCHLAVNLGDVGPGQGGSILLGWPNSDAQVRDVQFTTRILSSGDVNGGNNTSLSTASRLKRVPFISSPVPGERPVS